MRCCRQGHQCSTKSEAPNEAAARQGHQCSTDSEAPAQRALREGWSEAEVCAEKLPFRGGLCTECPGGSHCGSIGKKSTIGKKSSIGKKSTIRKKSTIGKKRAKMGNLH